MILFLSVKKSHLVAQFILSSLHCYIKRDLTHWIFLLHLSFWDKGQITKEKCHYKKHIQRHRAPKGHSGVNAHSAQSVSLYISKVLDKRNSYSEWWSQGPIQFCYRRKFDCGHWLTTMALKTKYSFHLELEVNKYNLVTITESPCWVKILQSPRVIILNINFHCPGSPSSPLWTLPTHAFGTTFRFTHSSILIFMSLGQTFHSSLLDYSEVFWIPDVSTPVLLHTAFKLAFLNPCFYQHVILLVRKLW